MNNSNGEIISILNDRTRGYGYLKSLTLKRPFMNGIEDQELELTLSREALAQSVTTKILFKAVSNLKIGELELLNFLRLTVEDISGRQLENITFEVTDLSHSGFSLWCGSIEFPET